MKDGTVLLRVTNSEGKVTHGSGFFTIEPGVIITNAHVVGMPDSKGKPTGKIEVVLRSGEADERTLEGEVLSIYRLRLPPEYGQIRATALAIHKCSQFFRMNRTSNSARE